MSQRCHNAKRANETIAISESGGCHQWLWLLYPEGVSLALHAMCATSLAKKDLQTGEILCFIVNTGEAEAKVHIECKNYSIKCMNPEDGLWYNAEEPDLVIEAKKGIIVKF